MGVIFVFAFVAMLGPFIDNACEECYEEGFEQGWKDGYKKGYEKARIVWKAKVDKCSTKLGTVLSICPVVDSSRFYRDSPSADVVESNVYFDADFDPDGLDILSPEEAFDVDHRSESEYEPGAEGELAPQCYPDPESVPYPDNDPDLGTCEPGEKPPDEFEEAQDGLPEECRGVSNPSECVNRAKMLNCTDQSKYWFNRGEAEMSVGEIYKARNFFSHAIRIGRPCGSEYAVLAAKRLSALNLTCEYTTDSLRRIARGAEKNPEGGDIIDLRIRQNALRALGHYEGPIDNRYGPATREAVRQFQREFGFSETGDLTPIETVYVICAAAQNASDIKSINVLGIMYIAGLGVVQNTDIGLRWLKLAASRGSGDALYNLAIIYGSGTVLSSYKLCSIVESEDIADGYLWEAAELDHPIAIRLIKLYGSSSYSPAERWDAIRTEQLEKVRFYNARLRSVGQGCEPNG